MELWLRNARATRDIDLSLRGPLAPVPGVEVVSDRLRTELEALTSQDLGDWFEFRVGVAAFEIEL
jgi:hypothetical protein